jgi:hypothetical protein
VLEGRFLHLPEQAVAECLLLVGRRLQALGEKQ